jgi:hypothetical protein
MKYYEFLENCKVKSYDGLVTNIHHIIPRSQGGSKEDCNLIKLSVHDHFWAHVYYAQEFKKCVSAPHLILKSFCAKKDFSELEWNEAAKIALLILSEGRKGITFSDEHRNLLSIKKIGNKNGCGWKPNEEQLEKMRNAKLGKGWKLIDGKRVWFDKENYHE